MNRLHQRVFRRILQIAGSVALLLIGAVKLIQLNGPQSLNHIIDKYYAQIPFISLYAAWLLVFMIPVFLFGILLNGLFSRRVLTLRTEAGQLLKIRESAVSRYVADRLDDLACIRAVRVEAIARRRGLQLRLRIWARADEPLGGLQQTVLERVVEYTRRGLGIDTVYPPDVLFEDIKPAAKRRAPQTAKNEPPEETGVMGASLPLLTPPDAEQPGLRGGEEPPKD